MAASSSISSSKIKRFIRSGIAILVLAIVFDWIIGALLGYLYFHQPNGDNADTNYAIFKSDADIFIIGPSLAKRHYDPRIFDSTLNLKTYNAGHDAQSLFYDLLLTKTIIKRKRPILIVLELGAKELYFKGYANDRLDDLLPYCRAFPREAGFIINLENKRVLDTSSVGRKLLAFNTEKVKMLSRVYAYNSQIVSILQGYTTHQESYSGFSPLLGALTEKRKSALLLQDSITDAQQTHLDLDKVNALKEIFKIVNENRIKLVIARSPNLSPVNSVAADSVLKELCNEYKTPIFDHSNDKRFDKIELYHDNHLDIEGAELYSKMIASQIKDYLGSIQ